MTNYVSVHTGAVIDEIVSLRVASGAGGQNICGYAAQWSLGGNTIDPTLYSVTVLGGSSGGTVNGGSNAVGKNIPANVVPLGTSNVGNNAADAYIAGTALYSQVFGYDNIANGLMSVILGSHSLTYTTSTHGYIIGSQCVISGVSDSNVILSNLNSIDTSVGSGILGGRQNRISGGGNYSVIAGGNGNEISSSANYQVVSGGAGNKITSSGSNNVIIGGNTGLISGTALGCVINGGQTVTLTNNYGVAIGCVNTLVSGQNASVFASEAVTASAAWSTTLSSNNIVNDTAGSLMWGPDTTGGKSFSVAVLGTSTNAAPTFLFALGGTPIRLPNSSAFTAVVQFTGFSGGTSVGYILNVSGEVSAAGVVNMHNAVATVIGAPSLVGTGLPTVQYVGGLTNQIYASVTGVLATVIKWRALFAINVVV